MLGDGDEEVEKNISEVTRRAIVDHLNGSDASWAGRYDDCEFLSRLYDLSALPSRDYRFETAAGDIRQHTVRNGAILDFQ